jgi:hypothetical protein
MKTRKKVVSKKEFYIFEDDNYVSADVPEGLKFFYLGRYKFTCNKASPDLNMSMDCAEFACAYRQVFILQTLSSYLLKS